MRAGLFGPEEISHLPLVGDALRQARMASLDVPPPRLRHETIRRVINQLAGDLATETTRRLPSWTRPTATRCAGPGSRWWRSARRWRTPTTPSRSSCTPGCIGTGASTA